MRIAFVSAPRGSAFMAEILGSVADAVHELGVEVITHAGRIEDCGDGDTVFVVVPHEYFMLSPTPPAALLGRTISFGVEHPGTTTFETAIMTSASTGARVEISQQSVEAVRARGLSAELYLLGYSPRWDRWGGDAGTVRPVDLAYLGTVDPERLRVLARVAPDLVGLETEILTPPHEPMITPRPDFLMGEAKWDLLARTKVLLNLHRERKTALEWVRTLEAMCNGCLVLSEPSTDLGPLIPGEHLMIASRSRLGPAARAAVQDTGLRDRIAAQAYELCRTELDMRPSAEQLVQIAADLRRTPAPPADMPGEVSRPPIDEGGPREAWLPVLLPLPTRGESIGAAHTRRRLAAARRRWAAHEPPYVESYSTRTNIDVICVAHPASGPLAATVASLFDLAIQTSLHVASIGWSEQGACVPRLNTFVACNAETTIGDARNLLVEGSEATYVLVLEAGDEMFPGTLAGMVSEMESKPGLDICYPFMANGSETLVNVFVPEQWRLERHVYLTRGYMVRRLFLERLGLFCTDPAVEPYVDHDFWLRAVGANARAEHLRWIGGRLWPTSFAQMPEVDAAEALPLIGQPRA